MDIIILSHNFFGTHVGHNRICFSYIFDFILKHGVITHIDILKFGEEEGV